MSLSTPFIRRPVATTLLTIAVALAGGLAYFYLPVSPLPQVDFPAVSVSASLPGASPETMASSVATPLERQFGRIAGITEMTSSSTLGTTNINLVFDLNRDIDAAARDVQAGINAAAGYLPANLPSKPTYKKINPADAPIMILTVTSDVYGKPQMYDAASSILAQKLSQVDGVGQVSVGGSALPGVRVEVNPTLLNDAGLGLQDVKATLSAANANSPKGQLSGTKDQPTLSLDTTDQLFKADQYRPLVITYRNGSAVRVGDVADVVDSVEDVRQAGLYGLREKPPGGGPERQVNKPAVLLVIFRQPGANIIATVDRINALIPQLQASIPAAMHIGIGMDRTTTIRASVKDVEFTLLISIALVIMVVFVFLRDWRATLIPSVAVPVSLIGTFAVMYVLGYSLDNLSLMALTIATGFVVDDAIVVVENISRYLEEGMDPESAALRGAAEIGFTVLSISVSLVAVFIPILLMGGYIGRLFREFAVTLSIAIGVSMIVSLTTTPMMCATLLKSSHDRQHGRLFRLSEAVFDRILAVYARGLGWVLRHQLLMLCVTVGTVALTVYLYAVIPKGFFPEQDTGRLSGFIKTDQDTSFQSMSKTLDRATAMVADDPAIADVLAFSGGRGAFNQAQMFATLVPQEQRRGESIGQVMVRLRGKTAHLPGASVIFQPVQDIRIGGRQSSSQYQYSLAADNLADLTEWAPKMLAKMRTMAGQGIVDADTDQQNGGLQGDLTIDRDTAARLGITPTLVDQVLYDAFGQEQVSVMYTQLNQYHVVMEVAPAFWQNPTDGLRHIYVPSTAGTQVPLSAFTKWKADTTPLAVNHSGQFPSVTLSFNLTPGTSLGAAVADIQDAGRDIGLPATIHGSFSGTAQAFQDALGNELILIAAALLTVYIILGVLYESLVHPVTILSTIPSAGVGALLALLLTGNDLTVIAVIGIVLLIGIVKKNAIMMIDFALEAERNGGLTPEQAIYQACVLRFRPITMTTMAALLGGLPLALGTGVGSELRKPLGIAIVGGLIFSQMLTLYTTPVIYLYLDRLRLWLRGTDRDHALAVVPA
jgi:hydrophobe/amphiphile efflux-1 (HAE1) family protein